MSLKSNLRILVVDDMSTSRGILVQQLETFGFSEVASVDSVSAAQAFLASKPVHIIISDFNMPDTNGLQFLHSLRHQEHTKGVGFILITGRPEPDIIEAGRKLGMNNFLKKPIQEMDLKQCLEALIGPF